MRKFSSLMLALVSVLVLCGACDKKNEPDGGGSSSGGDGNYGNLNGNLITIGSARDITYTSCVLLGTVDFPKITGDHSYGVVFMEALQSENFDYDTKLVYGGHSINSDKEHYSCEAITITNSTADGKFEKQLVNLMPATTYYYRAYVRIGQNVNYSKVEKLVTKDPMPEITMTTLDPNDIFAVKGSMNGVVNIGNLQDVNEDQEFGFIYTDSPLLNSPDKLTYEYYEQWSANHFETDEEIEEPDEVTTTTNLNGRITCAVSHLVPGTTYYYRTFFSWNGKYFYSPEVKALKTNGLDVITVGTERAKDITSNSAVLSATIPYDAIGLDQMYAGFLISKVYNNASEFKMENALPWDVYGKNADVAYITTTAYSKEFSANIFGLDPQTQYYICGYINLGNYGPEGEPLYVYGSMQHFTTEEAVFNPGTSTEGITFSSSGQYPWREVEPGFWMSTNKNQNGTSSSLVVTVNHKAGQTFSFDWAVSSEYNYDKFVVTCNGEQVLRASGEDDGEYSKTFTSTGTSTFVLEYSKDGSTSEREDAAGASDFRLSNNSYSKRK